MTWWVEVKPQILFLVWRHILHVLSSSVNCGYVNIYLIQGSVEKTHVKLLPKNLLRKLIKYYINISWSMWRVFEHHQFQPSWSLYQENWLCWQSMDAKKHKKLQPFGPTAESCSPATWFPSKDLTNQLRAPSFMNIWTPRGISLSSLSLDNLWCFPSHSAHYIVLGKKHSYLLPWSLAGWTDPSQPLPGRLIG